MEKKKKKGLAIKKIHSRLVTKQNTEKQNQKKSAREREQFSSEGRWEWVTYSAVKRFPDFRSLVGMEDADETSQFCSLKADSLTSDQLQL